MRYVKPVGHSAGVEDITPGTAGPWLGYSLTVIVKLKRGPDDLMPFLFQKGGHYGTIHAS